MRLLTKHQVAEILGVSVRSIDDWTQRGMLKVFKVGRLNRYSLRHIEDFLKVRRGTLSDAKPSTSEARK